MDKIILDCKGMQCPMPVIETRKKLAEISEGTLEVQVDNTTAFENLKKLAKSMNMVVEESEVEGIYGVTFHKGKAGKEGEAVELDKQPLQQTPAELIPELTAYKGAQEVILFTSEFLGRGEDELGKILMKGFIYTLSETEPFPAALLFLNSAIKLTTIQPETVENLKKLQDRGTKIISCGTCLDFYQLKDSLQVGVVGNMYDIVESLKSTTDKMVL